MRVDLRKVHFDKSATWNVWYQLGIDIDTLTEKLDVTRYYLNNYEQDKLVDYFLKNNTKMRFYKRRRNKTILRKQIAAEYLAYFPRGSYY